MTTHYEAVGGAEVVVASLDGRLSPASVRALAALQRELDKALPAADSPSLRAALGGALVRQQAAHYAHWFAAETLHAAGLQAGATAAGRGSSHITAPSSAQGPPTQSPFGADGGAEDADGGAVD